MIVILWYTLNFKGTMVYVLAVYKSYENGSDWQRSCCERYRTYRESVELFPGIIINKPKWIMNRRENVIETKELPYVYVNAKKNML